MKKIIVGVVVVLLVLMSVGWYLFDAYLGIDFIDEPALSGELKSAEVVVDGSARTLDYYLPAALTQDSALIFVLHGSMGNGNDVRKMSGYGFDLLADAEKLIVVYPDGYDGHWNDCRGSATYKANTENIDDIQFLKAMIEFFTDHYQIDRTRVFATGYSNGGHLALRAAFEMPEEIAAVAPIAASIPAEGYFDCERSGRPVPVAIFNGTNDPVNPYDGGLVEVFGDSSRGEVLSSADTAAYWKDLAGIKAEPEEREFPQLDDDESSTVMLKSWRGDNGVEVRLYTLQGSGHVIPSKTVRFGGFFGGSAADIDVAEEIWRFFEGVRRRQSVAD